MKPIKLANGFFTGNGTRYTIPFRLTPTSESKTWAGYPEEFEGEFKKTKLHKQQRKLRDLANRFFWISRAGIVHVNTKKWTAKELRVAKRRGAALAKKLFHEHS